MRRAFSRLFIGTLLLALGSPACLWARYAHLLTYETPRTQAMGGASVAVADDQQALYTNPAGLALIQDKGYAIVNAYGEMNQDFRRVNNKIDSLSDQDTPASRAENTRLLSGVMGQHARLAMSNLAYYLGAAGFGVGFLYQAVAEISVVRPTNPRIHAKGDIDTVLSGSIARPIVNARNVMRDQAFGWWGATVKFLSRRSIDREFDARDFASLSEDDLRDNQFKGATADLDAGMLWKLNNNPWNPTLGMFVGNIFETEIDPTIGRLRRQYGIGASFRPLTGPPERNRKLLLTADYWDQGDEGNWLTKMRLGLEAELRSWLKVQTGLRGGYLTAGFSADFGEGRVDFATYSVERGPRPGDHEDRRYSASLAFEF